MMMQGQGTVKASWQAVADPGLSVRGGVLSRSKRGRGRCPPPAPARGYGGAL